MLSSADACDNGNARAGQGEEGHEGTARGGCGGVMAGGDETETRVFNCKDQIPHIRLILMYNMQPPITFHTRFIFCRSPSKFCIGSADSPRGYAAQPPPLPHCPNPLPPGGAPHPASRIPHRAHPAPRSPLRLRSRSRCSAPPPAHSEAVHPDESLCSHQSSVSS